jgi:hypothetical protein
MLPQKHPEHSSIRGGMPAGSAAEGAQRASPSYRPAAPAASEWERVRGQVLVCASWSVTAAD